MRLTLSISSTSRTPSMMVASEPALLVPLLAERVIDIPVRFLGNVEGAAIVLVQRQIILDPEG